MTAEPAKLHLESQRPLLFGPMCLNYGPLRSIDGLFADVYRAKD